MRYPRSIVIRFHEKLFKNVYLLDFVVTCLNIHWIHLNFFYLKNNTYFYKKDILDVKTLYRLKVPSKYS